MLLERIHTAYLHPMQIRLLLLVLWTALVPARWSQHLNLKMGLQSVLVAYTPLPLYYVYFI